MNTAGGTKELGLPTAIGGGAPLAGSPALEITIHENEIPAFVAHELERLYESVYCTLERFRIYGEAHGASTYVARRGNALACLILFRIEERTVRVINQQIALSADDLRAFAQAIFARYGQVRVISFYAIDTRLASFPYPFQALEALEENVLTLPATAKAYMSSLSQNLLKRLQAAEKKLNRDFPGHRFEVLHKTAVTEEVLRQIIGLAGARMAAKQQEAYVREQDIPNILAVIHAYGHAGVLTIDGAVRGANVFYGVGRRYFMHIIAHDPDYDKYMLGHMVQYLAACHCIELGGRECCLMGGGRENKSRFGARPMFLVSVDIFRSRLHRMLSLRLVWGAAARRRLLRARHDFAELARADTGAGRAAARCVALLHRARQWRSRLPGAAK